MATAKEIKYLLLNTFFASIIFYLLDLLYTKTLRVQFEGTEKIQEHLENGGRIIIYSWHQRFFGGFFLPRIFKWSPCIIISQSRDGEFISKVVQHIGWIPVRGSCSRGGKEALQVMVQGVIENHIGGHIVDGPTGPPRVIKPGLISLARRTDAVICPGIVSYENTWIMNSWDHFMVPKPFSRVLFRFGSIFSVPEIMSDDQFGSFRKEVEDDLIKEYEAADNYWRK
ncbi:MAG: lysophospholipid acyltransferase family protein [Syntrophus sp. (in: bacteria)]